MIKKAYTDITGMIFMQATLNAYKEFDHLELPEYSGYFYEMFQIPNPFHDRFKLKIYDKNGAVVKEYEAIAIFKPERIHQIIDWELLHIWPDLLADDVPETPDEPNSL